MTQSVLTSIVMVTYHTGPVLNLAVAAALAQTVPVELILVNNGNPPDIEQNLKDLTSNEPRLTLVTGHGNVGFATACNMGARMAHGEHLLFLNPDSLLPVDAVEKILTHKAQLKPPYMLGARLFDEKGRDQRGCRRALLCPTTAAIEALHLHRLFPRWRLNFHEQDIPKTAAAVPAISGAFMFMDAKAFWDIQGFDEGYFLHVEDLDLCLRFRRSGGEIYFIPDIVVTHVGSTSKATSSFIERHKMRGFIRYFHKNFRDTLPLPILWLLDAAIVMRFFLLVSKSWVSGCILHAQNKTR